MITFAGPKEKVEYFGRTRSEITVFVDQLRKSSPSIKTKKTQKAMCKEFLNLPFP